MPQPTAEEASANSPARDTRIVGGGGEPLFRDRAPGDALLTGLEVGTRPALGSTVIKSVRPIFRTANGNEFLGQEHGSGAAELTTSKAKDGYAVGSMIVKAGLVVDGFSIVFMRVKGDALDPSDSYQSEWFGGTGGSDKLELAGDGRPVVALIGKSTDADSTGIGLLTKE